MQLATRLRMAAGRARPQLAGQFSAPSLLGGSGGGAWSSRHAFVATATIRDPVAYFTNLIVSGASGAVEQGSGGTLTIVKAAIEHDGVTTPLLFSGGVRSLVVADMASAIAAPVSMTIAAGDTFWIRLRYTFTGQYPAVNVNFPDGGSSYASGDECDATGDMTSGAIPLGNGYVWNATAVFGAPVGAATKTLAIIGDSMAFGYTAVEPGLGFIRRAINNTHATLLLGYNSELADYFVNSHTGREPLMALCDNVLIQSGINDMSSGSGTCAALQADVLAIAALAVGQRVFVCTLVPQTTSSDGWATTGNQTVKAWESERVLYNQWLRDGAPVNTSTGLAVTVGTTGGTIARCATYGTTGSAAGAASGTGHPFNGGAVFNTGGAIESALDSGKWKVPGYTDDGIHYSSPTGSTIMAAAIPVAVMA